MVVAAMTVESDMMRYGWCIPATGYPHRLGDDEECPSDTLAGQPYITLLHPATSSFSHTLLTTLNNESNKDHSLHVSRSGGYLRCQTLWQGQA